MKKTLNVGCGERIFKHYPTAEYMCINLDERDLDCVDVQCDVRKLPFTDEYFDMLLCSDIVEHFPIAEIPTILKEWRRVLKQGCLIEFRLPNLAAICKQYMDKRNAKNVSWLLYGGQDYSGNFHYTGFDRAYFKATCTEAGLEEISYEEEGFNMIVKMRKV